MRKILYILISPKGSGNTYIGSKVNKNTDIKFLRVEPISGLLIIKTYRAAYKRKHQLIVSAA
jgi:hypothetical protein